MLRVIGNEFRHCLRGGRWIFVIFPAILAAFDTWIKFSGISNPGILTTYEMAISANRFNAAALAVSLFVIASFESDEKNGTAKLVAMGGSRSAYYSGKVIFSYIIAAVSEALAVLGGYAVYSYLGYTVVSSPSRDVLSMCGLYFAVAMVFSTVIGFVMSAWKKGAYGLYTAAALYFIPPILIDFINDHADGNVLKYTLITYSKEAVRTASPESLQYHAGAGVAVALILLIVFALINKKKSV